MHGVEAQAHLGQHLGRGQAGWDSGERLGDGGAGNITGAMAAGAIRHRPEAEVGAVH